MKRRKTDKLVKTEQLTLATSVFPGLPLVFPPLSYHSVIVHQLKQLGVANIAIDIATINQLAGRLSLFKNNWEKKFAATGGFWMQSKVIK